MASFNLKRVFSEAFRRGRRPSAHPRLHSLEDRLAPAAQMVTDINTTPNPNGSWPGEFANFNGETYFAAYDAVHGTELWRTNGTEAGTVLVKDVQAGSYGSYPESMTPVGTELFFVAYDCATFLPALWKTDGTTDGTVLVKAFTGELYGQTPEWLTDMDGTLYFAMFGPDGNELWKTDGTTDGTVVVKDINPGPGSAYPHDLRVFNGELYFAADDGTNGDELWKTDGTEGGTVLVKDINSAGASSPRFLTELNGKLYFAAVGDSIGRELWSSDGTAAGTSVVADINPAANAGSNPRYLTDVNGTLYFNADDGTNGYELWKSDAGGTAMVKNIAPGGADSFPRDLTVVNSTLFFTANDGVTGRELWKSDGTETGTVLLKDIFTDNSAANPGSYPQSMAAFNGELYFSPVADGPQYGLWKSDGTEAGTVPVKVIDPNGTNVNACPLNLIDAYGTLLFRVSDGVHGPELWASDGTADGTAMVKDIDAGTADASPNYLTDIGGELYFKAYDGAHGQELWKSDGTAAGTSMVKDIKPGPNSAYIFDLTNVNGTLYFRADDGTHGSELWKTDGTEAGTVLVKDIKSQGSSYPTGMVNLNGKLLFSADDGVNGRELWVSDGTEAGTQMVKDVRSGPYTSYIQDMMVVGGVAYFIAYDGIHGGELWKSDGTEAGTQMVKDIYAGSYASLPQFLTDVGGVLYFSARDATNGRELWKSDGTEAGTVLVSDIRPGSGSSYPRNLVNADGTVYFQAYSDAAGTELWKTDGTEAGTVLAADIRPGPESSYAAPLAALNGTVYVHANDGTGYELWKADAGGVSLVKDISSSAYGSNPQYLTVYHGKLYFTALSETSGRELWFTDGTAAGTQVAAETAPGTADGYPRRLTVSGDRLYFSAYSLAEGEELWSFTDAADTTAPTVTIDQAAGQADPAESGPVLFSVVFSEPVTGFDNTDVDLSQSTVPGQLSVNVSETGPMDGTTYQVSVSGMAGDGDVVASVEAGAAKDFAGNDSEASTSTDNRVRFAVRPTVTIDQDPNQADPATAGPIVFDVVFSEDVTGFDGSKVDLSQSTVGGTLTANVTQITPATYRVEVTGMAGVGKVVAGIQANQVTDAAGNGNLASGSTDNEVTFFGGGTVGFYSAVLDTVDEGIGIYTVHVRRVGTQGDVTAEFSISAGTASANDFADNNTTHTLHWADGDDADQTFTIQIVDDNSSETRETINVSLTNIVGGVPGITSATASIDYSDPLGSGVSFVEADGDKVTLKLSPGTIGTLQYYLTDGTEPINRIVLSGTDSTKSVVTLSVKKAATGNGTVDVGEVVGSGVKSLNMAKANLTGAGINLTGPLGALTVGNVSGGADILAAGNPTLKTNIKAGAIGDGTVINAGSRLNSFTAASVGDSDIVAPSIGTVLVRGNFSGDITVSGVGVAAGKPALRTMRVLGTVSGSEIDVTGSVSAVTVGSFVDSHLFAGFTGSPGGSATPGATITLFQTTSKSGTFANSSVAADVIKTVSLWAVQTGNAGNPFGVFADTSIATVKIRSTGKVFKNPTDDGIDDFRVKVI